MHNNSIQVKGLHKSYKQLHVLNGIDFEVEKGSIFALLGPNGAIDKSRVLHEKIFETRLHEPLFHASQDKNLCTSSVLLG